MNRNTNNHFANVPTIDIKRSKFKRPHTYKTTYSTSELIPIYVDADILPGDTVKMDMGLITRMTTPIYPVMDNAFLDLYWFFTPHRLVWQHWREFWGENRETHWEQPIEYEIPQIVAPEGGWEKGSLADYFGLPTKLENMSVNHLPFRAYVQIVNDWFRDQNLKNPCMMNTDDTTLTGKNAGEDYDYVTDIQLGAKPYKAAKFHDYFTSCLPNPQKGPDVYIPLGDNAPVIVDNKNTLPYVNGEAITTLDNTVQGERLGWVTLNQTTQGMYNAGTGGPLNGNNTSVGFYADLNNAIGATVNQLRQAFAIQKFYEAQARGGSRYIEFIKNIFGVTSPDGRQQRSEYLGGKRLHINMDQVLQTSSTNETSPQGNTAAFSCTTDSGEMFTHSFTEHGTLMCLAVVRTNHTYQQGIERMWNRKKWTDFYVPQFANLGEQAVLNKEIYAQGTEADDEAFGYQEAWAEYRYKPSICTASFRSNYEGTLDAWHYADYYTEQPILSGDWIDETTANVDRTLAVQSELEDQFIGDFYFNPVYVRPMPVYSVPGLLDHH